uniref:Reverse transcriptase domain-containing protein n=1 Tax=Magnusiomyces paraingens TaxID=2606893 RepID=A0A6B9ISM2_9ASCO|nr:hypothetical protein [Saprochaete ingens]
MTPGIDGETLDGMSIDKIEKMRSLLRAGKYKFSPTREVTIPKPGKNEFRPTKVGSPNEKIVQKAITQIMEAYYDPLFQDVSHGFRPKRGIQTALTQIDSNFQSMRWVMEADLRKAFDSIDHNKLMNMLKRDIKDDKVMALIKSGTEAGYLDEIGKFHESVVGTPQGNITSPLTCNMFTNEFDKYIEELRKEYETVGNPRVLTREYKDVTNKMKQYKWSMEKGEEITVESQEYFKELMKDTMKTDRVDYENRPIKIKYVRYADDFMIGIEGPYKLAETIYNKMDKFLRDNLSTELNKEKTVITDMQKSPMKFTGFYMKSMEANEKMMERMKISDRLMMRRKKVRTSFFFDYEKTLKRLIEKGFIRWRPDKNNSGKNMMLRGRFKGNLMNLDHMDMVNYYNSMMRGLYNMYNMCRNMNNTARMTWTLEESYVLTLARKFRTSSMKKVYDKFGKNLSARKMVDNEVKTMDTFRPDSYERKSMKTWKKVVNMVNPEDLTRINWNRKYTKSNLFEKCVICNAESNIEMHHVRSIKTMKDKTKGTDFFTKQMSKINRKQIPLCRDHHMKTHRKKTNAAEIKTYKRSVSN